jgi:ribosomal peptide maturation radical SAM protein 1
MPDYSDYVAQLSDHGIKDEVYGMLYFESSRGCWWGAKHHCTFCGLNGPTMAFRRKDAEKVYREIVYLLQEYGCTRLFSTDNILAMEYFKDLLPKLASSNLGLQIFYEVKGNLRWEQLKLMRDAGITEIQPGIESFSSRLLQLMDKGITGIQNVQLLRWCAELDINTYYNILHGFPQERPEDYTGLDRLFLKLSHLNPPGLHPVMFERFSPYHSARDRYKLHLKAHSDYGFIYPASRVNLEKIAYMFEGFWEGQQRDSFELVDSAWRSLRTWKKYRGDIYCVYEEGPEGIKIADNRPRMAATAPRLQGFRLDAKLSALIRYCDECRTFPSIVQMMQRQFGVAVASERMVRQWVDQLVAQWFLYGEADRYVTLVVNQSKRHMLAAKSARAEALN